MLPSRNYMHSKNQATPQNQALNDRSGIETSDPWPQYYYPRRELGEKQASTPVRARRNFQNTLHYPPQKQPGNIKPPQTKKPAIAVAGNANLPTPPGGYKMTSFKHFHGRIKTFDEDFMLPEVERGDSRTDRTSKEYSKKHEKFFQETSRSTLS